MPATLFLKSKVSVCQPPAKVVVVCVSTALVASVWSSIFKRTGMPASGDQTRTEILVSVAVNGTFGLKPSPAGAVIVVPAKGLNP